MQAGGGPGRGSGGENYDLRETLHKTADTLTARLIAGVNHLLCDSKISTAQGTFADAQMSCFQMQIHHMSSIKTVQTLVQMAADLSVASTLLDHGERFATFSALKSRLEDEINDIMGTKGLGVDPDVAAAPSPPHRPETSSRVCDEVLFIHKNNRNTPHKIPQVNKAPPGPMDFFHDFNLWKTSSSSLPTTR